MSKRLVMEIMPKGDIVWSEEKWLLDIFENGGPDLTVMRPFDVHDAEGPGLRRLNPQYVIRCWIVDS